MGDESSLGLVEDDVFKFHVRGSNRLDCDELSLADAGVHASATGPEMHSSALFQQFSGQIQK
jgi:hypothetical protein